LQVVIVAYGDAATIRPCLDAIAGAHPTTVIDNSSNSQTKQLVESYGLDYHDPGKNLGFAAGVNTALKLTAGFTQDVLLLNPDAVIDAAGIERLRERLHKNHDVACVAPAQEGPSGSDRVAWPVPSPSGQWLEAFGMTALDTKPVFLIGSILLIKGEALADVGLFDERFFLYAEETDWQMRAFAKGWSAALVPEVKAFHLGAGTGGHRSVRRSHFYASEELLVRKHYGSSGWLSYRAAKLTGAALRAALRSRSRRADAVERFRYFWNSPVRLRAELGSSRAG
jgi:GT2 family glycosyltransferase